MIVIKRSTVALRAAMPSELQVKGGTALQQALEWVLSSTDGSLSHLFILLIGAPRLLPSVSPSLPDCTY